MIAPLRLNSKSQSIVSTLYENMKRHPFYAKYDISMDSSNIMSTGCISIVISKNGLMINMFMFCPKPNGNIHSIAIYGNDLRGHYNTISASKNIFGFKVSDISIDEFGYVDVIIEQY